MPTRSNAIAYCEGCSLWQVDATIPLAHLAPDIVEAAIAGCLSHDVALRDLRRAWGAGGLPMTATSRSSASCLMHAWAVRPSWRTSILAGKVVARHDRRVTLLGISGSPLARGEPVTSPCYNLDGKGFSLDLRDCCLAGWWQAANCESGPQGADAPFDRSATTMNEDDLKNMNEKDAMASAIAKAHRSAIKSYEKSSASFSRQADALRSESSDASSAKTDKMIRALEKLSAACLAKAADHERKIEKRAS